MSKLRWLILIVIFSQLFGCKEDPTSPVYFVETDQTATFEFTLPPLEPDQESLEFEALIDLGVRINDLSSVVISTKGTAYAATHACDACEPASSSTDGPVPLYQVRKDLAITLESNLRTFRYHWVQGDDGAFVLVDEPLACDFVCDTFFADGTGSVKVRYGNRELTDAFMCHTDGEEFGNPVFCVLDPGSLVFEESLVLSFAYKAVTTAGGKGWQAVKSAYR